MRRYGLRDDQWDRIKDLLPGREGSVGVTACDNRLFVEAVLALGQKRCLAARVRAPGRGRRQRICDDRQHHRSRPSAQRGRPKKAGEDALGNPTGFFLTGGEAHDLVGADHFLPQVQADTLIADKAFDAEERVIQPLQAAGKTAVIPPKKGRKSTRDYDRDLFKARHLIENFFAKLKQFRAIATRHDKTARNFLAATHLAASLIWLN
jgi:transposase